MYEMMAEENYSVFKKRIYRSSGGSIEFFLIGKEVESF